MYVGIAWKRETNVRNRYVTGDIFFKNDASFFICTAWLVVVMPFELLPRSRARSNFTNEAYKKGARKRDLQREPKKPGAFFPFIWQKDSFGFLFLLCVIVGSFVRLRRSWSWS